MSSEISEAQQIEMNRRVDVMFSIIPSAKHIMFMRSDIRDQLTEINKSSRKLVMACVFFFGLIWHWVVSDGGLSLDFGVYISLIAALYWIQDSYKINSLEKQDNKYVDRLWDLSVVWCSVTTQDRFFEILKFETELGTVSEDDERYLQWISDAKEAISYRVWKYH